MHVSSRSRFMNENFSCLNWLLGLVILFLFSCQPPATNGFAPGVLQPDTLPTPASGGNYIKYGEAVTTSNGWVVNYDSADSIEHTNLPNGWTIEVKYE